MSGAVFYFLYMPSLHGEGQLYTFIYMENNGISFMEHQEDLNVHITYFQNEK
jgi:hypothetical protein